MIREQAGKPRTLQQQNDRIIGKGMIIFEFQMFFQVTRSCCQYVLFYPFTSAFMSSGKSITGITVTGFTPVVASHATKKKL